MTNEYELCGCGLYIWYCGCSQFTLVFDNSIVSWCNMMSSVVVGLSDLWVILSNDDCVTFVWSCAVLHGSCDFTSRSCDLEHWVLFCVYEYLVHYSRQYSLVNIYTWLNTSTCIIIAVIINFYRHIINIKLLGLQRLITNYLCCTCSFSMGSKWFNWR